MQFMGSSRILLACASLVVFAVAGASHAPRATAVGEARTILVPEHGALFGAWTKPRSGRTVQQELAYTEQQVGRRFDIFHLYYHVDKALPTRDMVAAKNSGHTILMSFDPDPVNATPTWQGIARGDQDALLTKRAQELRGFGVPVMLTFDHEADSNIGAFGTPADYVAAFRRVHRIFRDQGATNVIWVWNMEGELFADPATADAMYPGDEYVDWISADAYNWYPGKSGSKWRSFAQAFAPFRQWAMEKHPDKPQMAAETGVQEDTATPDGGRKAAWIRDMAATLRSWPEMKAVVWFNSNKIYPWWYDSTAASLNAFAAVGRDCWLRTRDAACAGSGSSDTAAPTAPGSLTASDVASASFTLSWTASSDDTGVSRYDILVDGVRATSTTALGATVTGKNCSAGCSVSVVARDAAGNASPPATVVVTSPPPAAGGTASGLVVTPSATQVKVAFTLSASATVSVVISNASGAVVARKLTNAQLAGGPQAVYWKRKDDRGSPVAPGTYSVRVTTGSPVVTSSLAAVFRLT